MEDFTYLGSNITSYGEVKNEVTIHTTGQGIKDFRLLVVHCFPE